jgi:hypothetical protein
MKKLLMILSLLLLAVVSQEQSTITWYFGNQGGMIFNPDGTTSIKSGSAMNTTEGCTVVSDQDGNIMFYADGKTVWDHNGIKVYQSLSGGPSSTQAALAVPIPGSDCQKFLIFTTLGTDDATPELLGVALAIVTGTSPNYVVVVKDPAWVINPDAGVTFSEKLAATSDGKNGFWVAAHDFKHNSVCPGNSFYLFHVMASDFANVSTSQEAADKLNLPTVKYVKNIGTYHLYTNSKYDGQGQMKFSYDGTKLGLVLCGSKLVDLFSFDVQGAVLTWLDKASDQQAAGHWYGCEFSKSGNFLYVAEGIGSGERHIYQWNVSGNTLSNKFTVATGSANYYQYNALQLGPNGKIYCSEGQDKAFLSVINYPDQPMSACLFSSLSVPIFGTNELGLPTVATNFGCATPNPTTTYCPCKAKSTVSPIKIISRSEGQAVVEMTLNSGDVMAKFVKITWTNFDLRLNNADCKKYCDLEPYNMGMFNKIPQFPNYEGIMVPKTSEYSHCMLFTTSEPKPVNDVTIEVPLWFPKVSELSCCYPDYYANFIIEYIDENCSGCAVQLKTSSVEEKMEKPVKQNTSNVQQMQQLNFNQDDRQSSESFKVYPNPNDGTFTINTASIGSNLKYEIKNMNGVMVASGTLSGTDGVVNLTFVSKSTYIVTVFHEGNAYTQKVVVQ